LSERFYDYSLRTVEGKSCTFPAREFLPIFVLEVEMYRESSFGSLFNSILFSMFMGIFSFMRIMNL
jgi:hypothetical protein